MANKLFRNEYISRVRHALARAEQASKLDHNGLVGRAREIFVKELLLPVLPPYVVLGSGKIADSEEGLSREVDVVIYSAATLPPFLLETGFGVYPAEACIYAIEVKSTLTAEELRNAVEKARALRKLHYLPSVTNTATFQGVGQPSPPVIPAVFAFQTDLSPTGKSEIARYREMDTESDTNPAVPVICVAGRGYWWFKGNEPAEKWIHHLPNDDHEEVIDFVSGVANTIPERILTKGRPRLGRYLMREREFKKV